MCIRDRIRENCIDKELNKFYRFVDEKLYRLRRREWKLYVPNSVSGEIIAEIHRMYGHPGAKRCIKLLQEYFTIDGMLKRVKNYVRACDTCQRKKDSGNKNLFGGTKAIIPLRKGDLVSAVYYGPLPASSAGVRYLFVMVDNFTKYVRLFTLRRATTVATLRRIQ